MRDRQHRHARLLGFVGIAAYQWVFARLAPVHLPASRWAAWVFAFLFHDFCFYGSTAWATPSGAHAVHHRSEEFNRTAALRQPGTSAFSFWMFYLPMALCGIPVSVYLIVGVLQLFYQFWHRNYAGAFLLRDHWFGTFQEELDSEPCIYGIRGQLKRWNPVWANLQYCCAMAQDSWRAGRWRVKLRIWYAPPGGRPADVAARFPKPPYEPRATSRSSASPAASRSTFTSRSGFWRCFLGTATSSPCCLSLGVLGGLLESLPVFVALEAVRLAAVTGFVLLSGG